MKIVHTEMELRASGIERLDRATVSVRQNAIAKRVRFAIYAAVVVAAILIVSLLLK